MVNAGSNFISDRSLAISSDIFSIDESLEKMEVVGFPKGCNSVKDWYAASFCFSRDFVLNVSMSDALFDSSLDSCISL